VSLQALDRLALRCAERLRDGSPKCDYTINQLPLVSTAQATDLVPIYRNNQTYAAPATAFIGPPGPPGSGIPFWFIITSYGAVGDGVTDSTVAIQNTIAAAAASSPVGLVYMPAGTYVVSGSLYVPSNVVIMGAGIGLTTIKPTAGFAGTAGPNGTPNVFVGGTSLVGFYTKTAHGTSTRYTDFTLDCSSITWMGSSIQGISIANVDYAVVERVRVIGPTGYAISLDGGAAYGAPLAQFQLFQQIRYCVFINTGRGPGMGLGADGIGGGYTLGELVTGCEFNGSNGSGMDRVTPLDGTWSFNSYYNPTAQQNAGFWTDFGALRLKIIGNTFSGGGSIHINGYLAGVGGDDARPTAQNYCVIMGNTFLNGGSNAIQISTATPDSASTNVAIGHRVIGNVINGCYDSAISLAGTQSTLVEGNYIQGWNFNNSGSNGIYILSGLNPALLTQDNAIRNNTFGAQHTGVVNCIADITQQYNTIEGNNVEQGVTLSIFVTNPSPPSGPAPILRHNSGCSSYPVPGGAPGMPASGVTVKNTTSYDVVALIALFGTGNNVIVNGLTFGGGISGGPTYLAVYLGVNDTIAITYTSTPAWYWTPVNLR